MQDTFTVELTQEEVDLIKSARAQVAQKAAKDSAFRAGLQRAVELGADLNRNAETGEYTVSLLDPEGQLITATAAPFEAVKEFLTKAERAPQARRQRDDAPEVIK